MTIFPQEHFEPIWGRPVLRCNQHWNTRELLATVAKNSNRKIDQLKRLPEVTVGHPRPEELYRGAPPCEVIGYCGSFRVTTCSWGHCVLADLWIYRTRLQLLEEFPEVSAGLTVLRQRPALAYIYHVAVTATGSALQELGRTQDWMN